MKALLMVIAILVTATCVTAPTQAQTPFVGVFFDQALTRMDEACPEGDPGTVDTAFVVAKGFNAFIMGIEYSINYPPSMVWFADFDTPPVSIGQTPNGISEGFPLPQNGYNPIVVAKVQFVWNCDGCETDNQPVIVSPHPLTGFVRATDYPNYDFINAVGMTSLICATVPTEETTWGKIKSMYGE